tara:strand:+ start:705 stop:1091 length:387 start_codon:yes stop_codon:yes gene_type:complete
VYLNVKNNKYLITYFQKENTLNEKNFITSGRNTIIHKNRKIDLLMVNGNHPVVMVSHAGIDLYDGVMPTKRSEAKKAYQELVDVSTAEVFGEEKTLVFIQALDNKEYKLDYSKVGTANFIKVHQQNYI